MYAQVNLDFTVRLTITALDIRQPIFAYYHEVERSADHEEALEHGMALVSKRFHDGEKHWITLSFPDLPHIYCLDEQYARFSGIPLQKALDGSGDRIAWGHEHFITAIWEGTQLGEFKKLYRRLREILGEKFPKDPEWEPHRPTPRTLEEVAATLKTSPVCQEDPLPF